MVPESSDKTSGEHPVKIRGSLKLVFALLLAGTAGLIGYFQIFRTHPAQSTVEQAFRLVEEGDIEGVMKYVDPGGQLGVTWYENEEGARDTLLSLAERYRLEFSSLSFGTRVEGDVAEVELRGGRVTIYSSDEGGMPAFTLDLKDSGLVFYLEKREDNWLIQGINYDIVEILGEGQTFFPF